MEQRPNRSDVGEGRRYLTGALIVLGILALFMTVVVVAVFSMIRPNLQRETASKGSAPTAAGAALPVPDPMIGSFSVSSTVDIPLPPPPYSEPSLQFDVRDSTKPVFWEAGIIRARRYKYQLAGFVHDAAPRRRPHVMYLSPIGDGPHRMTLARSGNLLVFSIDDHTVYRFTDAPVLPGSPLRVAMGTSFGISGERASGSFTDLHIVREAVSSSDAPEPRCSVSWGGVALVPIGSRWVLQGVTDLSRLRERTRHCRNDGDLAQ